MNKRPTLEDIFDQIPDDEVKPSNRSDPTSAVQQKFEEINQFIDDHGKLPTMADDAPFCEQSLAASLNALVGDNTHHGLLGRHDRHGLLPSSDAGELLEDQLPTLDQILKSLPDEIADAPDITQLRHVRKKMIKRRKPDRVSQRRACEDFDQFEPLFRQASVELEDGVRKAIPYRREQEIREGQFFILKGVWVYIAEVGEIFEKAGKKNARMRVVFGNGTEGNNLRRALSAELYKDRNSRRITAPQYKVERPNNSGENSASNPPRRVMAAPENATYDGPPTETGTLYVLRSLSREPVVQQYGDRLIKIGVTKGNVKQRIANAVNSPTYLLAPVEVVAEFRLENIQPIKLERLLHLFFSDARATITIKDRFDKDVQSREWFFLTPDAVKAALDHFIAGTLKDVRFDPATGQVG